MVKRKNRRYIMYIILLFIYIFSIPFIHYNTQVLMEIIAFGIIFFRICGTGKIYVSRKFFSIVGGYLPFIVYISVFLYIHCAEESEYFSAYYETYILFIKFFIRTIIICVFFELYRVQNRIDKQSYINALIIVAFMQLICVILAFISPAIRMLFITLVKNNTTIAIIKSNLQHLGTRSYGLAENLFDGFGYVCALLIIITFWMGMKEKRIFYIVLSIIMLIMPALNTRTGIVLSSVGFIFIFFFWKHNKENLRFSLKILAVGIPILIIALVIVIRILPESTLEWIKKGMEEVVNLLINKQKTGTFEIIANQLVLPDNIAWGAGSAPEYLNIAAIDMGYAQCLWRYGIIGTALLLLGYINSFRIGLLSTKCKDERVLLICMSLVFFIYLYKIYSIGNMAGNLIIFGYIILIVEDKQERKFILCK